MGETVIKEFFYSESQAKGTFNDVIKKGRELILVDSNMLLVGSDSDAHFTYNSGHYKRGMADLENKYSEYCR